MLKLRAEEGGVVGGDPGDQGANEHGLSRGGRTACALTRHSGAFFHRRAHPWAITWTAHSFSHALTILVC